MSVILLTCAVAGTTRTKGMMGHQTTPRVGELELQAFAFSFAFSYWCTAAQGQRQQRPMLRGRAEEEGMLREKDILCWHLNYHCLLPGFSRIIHGAGIEGDDQAFYPNEARIMTKVSVRNPDNSNKHAVLGYAEVVLTPEGKVTTHERVYETTIAEWRKSKKQERSLAVLGGKNPKSTCTKILHDLAKARAHCKV